MERPRQYSLEHISRPVIRSGAAVPNRPLCPKCQKNDLVRFETVLARGRSHRAYYCGGCNYSWNVEEDGHSSESDGPPERPDRSRPPK